MILIFIWNNCFNIILNKTNSLNAITFETSLHMQGLGEEIAQWWECLTPTNVVCLEILDDIIFGLRFFIFYSEIFLQVRWFSPLLKNQHLSWFDLKLVLQCYINPLTLKKHYSYDKKAMATIISRLRQGICKTWNWI